MKKWTIVSTLAFLLLTISFLISCDELFPEKESSKSKIEIYPENNSVVWGYQVISIFYDLGKDVGIDKITYSYTKGEALLNNDDNPVRSEVGCYEVNFCAECIESYSVDINFIFTGEDAPDPITVTYAINHMPVVFVYSEMMPEYNIKLTASESYDPEGEPLVFSWFIDGTTYEGSEVIVHQPSSDSINVVNVSDGYTTNQYVFTVNSDGSLSYWWTIECIAMGTNVGFSLLNPGIRLGPSLAPGTQLAVDANKKTTQPYCVGYGFEIVAVLIKTLTPIALIEGQAVARTSTYADPGDPTKTILDHSTVGGIQAPFPVTIPNPGQPASAMNNDDYNNHPLNGTYGINVPAGCNYNNVICKAVIGNLIVWLDQPGYRMPAGFDLSKGFSYKGYFHSLVFPSAACQQFYYVEVEVDSDGKVIKNQWTLNK